MQDSGTQCKMEQVLMMLFFLINNLNEFGKFKVGEQFFSKLPVSDKNDYGYRYGKDFGLNL